jgi:hypothetical protein
MNPPPPNVRSIFGRALEIESAAARAAFLDEACGPDAALRGSRSGPNHRCVQRSLTNLQRSHRRHIDRGIRQHSHCHATRPPPWAVDQGPEAVYGESTMLFLGAP